MRIKRFTAALLAGVLLTFSMAGTCFAYSEENTEEPAEAAAETSSSADTTNEAASESVPYNVTSNADGTYTFSLGDYD